MLLLVAPSSNADTHTHTHTHTHTVSAIMSVGCIDTARILGRAECQAGLSIPILSSFCPRGLAVECFLLHA